MPKTKWGGAESPQSNISIKLVRYNFEYAKPTAVSRTTQVDGHIILSLRKMLEQDFQISKHQL